MSLSRDLISQFVKITKDKPKTKTETIVYGIMVDDTHVKIDGSKDDSATPIQRTAIAKAGDRVTVLIKNHTAVVTGNLGKPAVNDDVLLEKDYASKTHVETRIDQKIGEINIGTYATVETVNQKVGELNDELDKKADSDALNSYATKTEMNSQLSLKADSATLGSYAKITDVDGKVSELNASIETKVNIDKLTTELKAQADTIELISDKLIIKSGTFSLSEGGIVIDAQNFKLDKDGTVTSIGGNIGGFELKTDYLGTHYGLRRFNDLSEVYPIFISSLDKSYFTVSGPQYQEGKTDSFVGLSYNKVVASKQEYRKSNFYEGAYHDIRSDVTLEGGKISFYCNGKRAYIFLNEYGTLCFYVSSDGNSSYNIATNIPQSNFTYEESTIDPDVSVI